MLKDRSPLQHFPLHLSFPLCRQQCAGCRGRSQQSTVGCYHHISWPGWPGAASHTTHYTHSAMLRGHRCRGREYSVLSLCDHCDYVRYVPVGRVREHSLMMLSDYLTLVMIHRPPCLHGHGGGGVLMYYSTGALNTKYYCDSMHYVCVCFCDQVFCFPTQRMTFDTIRFTLSWKQTLFSHFSGRAFAQ